MVSRVRWCSRIRNPLPGMGSFLPRKRENGVPSGELVGPGVEQEDGEQRPGAAASAQVRAEPVEQRQRGRTFQGEREVPEVTRERFRQRPEEDPGERERVPGKGE